mgnify:CR=1 FL=1
MKLINIGSHNSNEYKIDDSTVSRKHAQLFWDGKKLVILTDLDSTNGTFVNGKKLKIPTQLNQLDVVKVGNTLIPWMELLFEENIQEEIKIPVSKASEPKFLSKGTWIFLFVMLVIVITLLTHYRLDSQRHLGYRVDSDFVSYSYLNNDVSQKAINGDKNPLVKLKQHFGPSEVLPIELLNII